MIISLVFQLKNGDSAHRRGMATDLCGDRGAAHTDIDRAITTQQLYKEMFSRGSRSTLAPYRDGNAVADLGSKLPAPGWGAAGRFCGFRWISTPLRSSGPMSLWSVITSPNAAGAKSRFWFSWRKMPKAISSVTPRPICSNETKAMRSWISSNFGRRPMASYRPSWSSTPS